MCVCVRKGRVRRERRVRKRRTRKRRERKGRKARKETRYELTDVRTVYSYAHNNYVQAHKHSYMYVLRHCIQIVLCHETWQYLCMFSNNPTTMQ